MIQVISKQEFFKTWKEWGINHAFADVELIAIQEQVFGVEAIYLAWIKKGKFLWIMQYFTKDSTWVSPINIAYQNAAFDPNLSHYESLQAQEQLTEYLHKFKKASIRFPIGFKHVELLNPPYFQRSTRFSYLKLMDDDAYAGSSPSNIKSFAKENPRIEINSHLEKSWEMASELIPASDTLTKDFCFKAIEQGRMIAYNVFVKDELLASNWVFINGETSAAYLYLLSKTDRKYKGLHEYLYDQIFIDLKARGCKIIDLGGANIPAIAKFKSTFNVEQVAYYQVYLNAGLMGKIATRVQAFADKIFRF
jgi:hypothetical protein